MDTFLGVAAGLCLLLTSVLALGQFFIWRRLTRISEVTTYLTSHAWNTSALFAAARISYPPSAPEGWAASSDLLAEIYRLVIARKPQLVVELGSGLSTLFIASALEANGSGRLISVDDKLEYLEATRKMVQHNRLDDRVEFRLAPVQPQRFEGETLPWYRIEAFDDLSGIDMLLIDGPGVHDCEQVRKPALPALWEKLRAGAICVLDDADRPGERAVGSDWQRRYPAAEFQRLGLRKGALLVTKPTASTGSTAPGPAASD